MAKSGGPSSAGLSRLRSRVRGTGARVTISEYRGKPVYQLHRGGSGIYARRSVGDYRFISRMISEG